MACSTAAKSSMKVIRSVSAPTSLQYLCCSRLRKLLPSGVDALRVLPLPPGLRHLLHSKLGWVLSLDHTHTQSNTHTPTGPSSSSDSEGCSSDPEACQRKRCRWTWGCVCTSIMHTSENVSTKNKKKLLTYIYNHWTCAVHTAVDNKAGWVTSRSVTSVLLVASLVNIHLSRL